MRRPCRLATSPSSNPGRGSAEPALRPSASRPHFNVKHPKRTGDAMSLYPSHADPPLGLAGRLYSLNETLRSLASRLRDSIAQAVGGAVANAIRDVVRSLLGEQDRRPKDNDTFGGRFERDDRFGFAD